MKIKLGKKHFLASAFALFALSGCSQITGGGSGNDEFLPQANSVDNCPSGMFVQSAVIFDSLIICATNKVPLDKLQHAANVTAEWLDNNGDGVVDEPRVADAMKANKAIVLMSYEGMSDAVMEAIFPLLMEEGYTGQDLYAVETNNPSRRDASQEEIHHIIMNGGWIKAFPEVFSDQRTEGSDLYKVWKYADDNGHYAYDDPTCDDSCKVTEFAYLATASYLGSKADLFSDEMRLKDQAAMRSKIPEIFEIFESKDYVYPTIYWPRGDYPHQKHIQYFGVSN